MQGSGKIAQFFRRITKRLQSSSGAQGTKPHNRGQRVPRQRLGTRSAPFVPVPTQKTPVKGKRAKARAKVQPAAPRDNVAAQSSQEQSAGSCPSVERGVGSTGPEIEEAPDELTRTKRELESVKQIFEKMRVHLIQLQLTVTQLRDERHRLVAQAMDAEALQRRLAAVTEERDKLLRRLPDEDRWLG